ncbi:hypothetical protein EUGRSUZ_C04042 [Eucalyptus grandis]|uniref:Uncharacterized protein n=2 Tax=Eucalyptus grandis TaxID=71139 RepID=A0ACC3LL99_EUCGR|nr:hypothetical protein EUGRSUZ_C04042 [Eucalyptus grandis]
MIRKRVFYFFFCRSRDEKKTTHLVDVKSPGLKHDCTELERKFGKMCREENPELKHDCTPAIDARQNRG